MTSSHKRLWPISTNTHHPRLLLFLPTYWCNNWYRKKNKTISSIKSPTPKPLLKACCVLAVTKLCSFYCPSGILVVKNAIFSKRRWAEKICWAARKKIQAWLCRQNYCIPNSGFFQNSSTAISTAVCNGKYFHQERFWCFHFCCCHLVGHFSKRYNPLLYCRLIIQHQQWLITLMDASLCLILCHTSLIISPVLIIKWWVKEHWSFFATHIISYLLLYLLYYRALSNSMKSIYPTTQHCTVVSIINIKK